MEQKTKVLVTDDDPQVVDLLAELLAANEFDVLKAYSGHEAIEAVTRNDIDLLLLDIAMPGMDGYKTCEFLRKSPANNSLPIVMLTGLGDESAIVQALEYGADGYVTKPFVQKELLNTIQGLLVKAKTGQLPSQFYFKKIKSEKGKKIE